MHGQPRKAPKPEDEAASAAKAEKLRNLQSQFLCFHRNNMYYSLFPSLLFNLIFDSFSFLWKKNKKLLFQLF